MGRVAYFASAIAVLATVSPAHGQGAAAAPAPTPSATPAPTLAGPDDSPFAIPSVPIPANAFGKALQDACQVLTQKEQELKDAKKTVDAKKLFEAAPRAARGQVDALKEVAVTVNAACQAILTNSLTPEHLTALRAFRDSGSADAIGHALRGAENARGDQFWSAAVEEFKSTVSGSSNPLEALSGLESKFVDGLADFLVTRSKQEAIQYLQEQINERFCKDERIHQLLPRTCQTMAGLDSSLSVAAMGAALNGAARRDLEALPDSALKLASKDDREHYFIYEPARLGYALYRETTAARNPKDLVTSLHRMPLRRCEQGPLPANDPASVKCRNAFGTLRVASAMSFAIQANGVDTVPLGYLRSADFLLIGTLLDGEAAYLGAGVFRELSAEELTLGKRAITDASGQIASWTNALKPVINPGANDKSSAEDRRKRLAAAVQQITLGSTQTARSWLRIFAPDPQNDTRQELERVFDVSDELATLGRDLVSEEYGAVIADFSELVSLLRQRDLLTQAPTPESGGKRAPASWIGTVGKLTPLIAEIASAESSKDVATALEAAAAPAGSYKAKYQRAQVALNALVGGLYGGESVRGPRDPSTNERTSEGSAMLAGFAPVGIHASTPFLKTNDGGHHFHVGVMVSLLDLGALTTHRFDEELSTTQSVDSAANIGFAQLFSPGAYLTLGLFESPFVIGGGASFAPSLRSVDTKDASGAVISSEDVPALRYGAFVAMDLTLLPF